MTSNLKKKFPKMFILFNLMNFTQKNYYLTIPIIQIYSLEIYIFK